MPRLTTLSIIFNALFLAGLVGSCASGVERPDTDLCLSNVPKLHELCTNLKRDYDDNGELKPGVKPQVRQYKDEAEMLAALNKKTCTDPNGLANLKAYVRELRAADGRRGD